MDGHSWSQLSTNQKSAIAEAMISAEAAKHGILVSRPNLDTRYDLVFDTGTSLLRVQCKCGALEADASVIKVNLESTWYTSTGYVRNTYAAGEVDLFAVYCAELNRCYLIDGERLVERRAIHLRLSEPRNKQRACVNLASDFTFDGAIAQLGERLNGIQEVAGSSPASSISDAPPVVVGANRFRDRFGWYMERAAAGEVFQITRHGRPFVRLGPATTRD